MERGIIITGHCKLVFTCTNKRLPRAGRRQSIAGSFTAEWYRSESPEPIARFAASIRQGRIVPNSKGDDSKLLDLIRLTVANEAPR